MRGTWSTEHLSLFFFTSEAFLCNVLSDSKVYFSLLRKLSSTSSDGVRSGNLDVPCGTFWGRRLHGFSRDLVFISLDCADIVFVGVPLAWCRKGA